MSSTAGSVHKDAAAGDGSGDEGIAASKSHKGATGPSRDSVGTTAASGSAASSRPKKNRQATGPASRSSREGSPSGVGPALPGSNQSTKETQRGLISQTSQTSQPSVQQPHTRKSAGNVRLGPSKSLSNPKSSGTSTRKQTETPSGAPAIVLQKEGAAIAEGPDDTQPFSGMRTPRSNSSPALETVVESSLPSTPAIGTSRMLVDQVAALAAKQRSKVSDEEDKETSLPKGPSRVARADSVASSVATRSLHESESESGYKSEERTPTSSYHKATLPSKFTNRQPAVSRDMSRGMTVETETVSSVPQVGLGSVGPPGVASVKSKKSTDTIRAPRKEKKRSGRKTAGTTAANVSSKSDIFAQKIAEAVDEANSSDSDETFVYESNPPESAQRPSSRFHSRTPSATSLGGPDPRGLRLPLLSAIDGSSSGRGRMKFTSHSSLNKESSFGGDGHTGDTSSNERGAGSSRGFQNRRDRTGGRHHNGHRSILADDNPFHGSSDHKSSNNSLRNVSSSLHSSRPSPKPTSPKLGPRHGGNGLWSKKSNRWTSYEADIEGADDGDEGTPLIRAQRRRGRLGASTFRQHEHRRRGWVRTYAGCLAALVAVIIVLAGVSGFLVATTNALVGVRVVNVTDVLVSKQEIMLDLVVEAINPNIIAVTIGSMDVNLFAKSSHVREGGDDERDDDRRSFNVHKISETDAAITATTEVASTPNRASVGAPFTRSGIQYHASGNVDEGTDPPDDLPENDKETMLLGRIFSFDSVLTFEGTPFRHTVQTSSGELRLAKPGNETEEGGTERWERVLLHPFELVVRGVLKYQLPLSGRTRTTPISGSVMINPGDEK